MVYLIQVLIGYLCTTIGEAKYNVSFSSLYFLLYCHGMYMADGFWVDGFIRVVGTCGVMYLFSMTHKTADTVRDYRNRLAPRGYAYRRGLSKPYQRRNRASPQRLESVLRL